MKTFYGVFQSYDDRGKVKAHIFTVEAEKKPESTFESTKKADIYNDYFDSKAAAQEYLEGALNA